MSRWGVPDWQDGKAYDPQGDWTLAQWQWQFIRRSAAYRQDAMPLLEVLLTRTLEDDEWRPFWERWGFDGVPDPRRSDYSRKQLTRWPHKGVGIMVGSPDNRSTNRNKMDLASDEIAIRLNLDKPIEPQIQIAKAATKRAQIERHGKLIDHRRHKVKWQSYLRLLDGRASGATWNELASILTYSAQRPHTARDAYKAAVSLRDSFAH